MSKAEILDQLSKLSVSDRSEVFLFLLDLEDNVYSNSGPSLEEKHLLDDALQYYHDNPNTGSRWSEVESRILS